MHRATSYKPPPSEPGQPMQASDPIPDDVREAAGALSRVDEMRERTEQAERSHVSRLYDDLHAAHREAGRLHGVAYALAVRLVACGAADEEIRELRELAGAYFVDKGEADHYRAAIEMIERAQDWKV